MEIESFEKILLDVHFGEETWKDRKATVNLVKDTYIVDCFNGEDVQYVRKSSYQQAQDAAENWVLGYHP